MTTTDQDTTEADALRGPWRAVAADAGGWPTTDIPTSVAAIRVVRVPIADKQLRPRFHGEPLPDDVAYEVDTFGDEADVEERWVQAQAMAAGLNAAAGKVNG